MVEELIGKVLQLVDLLAVVVAMVGTEMVKAVDKGWHDPDRKLQRRSRGQLRRWYPVMPIACALVYLVLIGGWRMPAMTLAKAIAFGSVASWLYRIIQGILGKDKA